MLPADDAAPSSSASLDIPIFSDEPTQSSSPNSSPPGFPWERKAAINEALRPAPKPSFTAFSVLGKRKALGPVSANPRPTKRPTVAATETTKPLTQTQLSAGQQVQKTCKQCGMEYIVSSAEDRKLHDAYHRQNVEGYEVGKDFVRKARPNTMLVISSTQDCICAVDCFDTTARKRCAQAVLDIVQKELGAVSIAESDIWDSTQPTAVQDGRPNFTAYMYIKGTKCVALLLVERIKEAYVVLGPTNEVFKSRRGGIPSNPSGSKALSALRARQQAAQAVETNPLQIAKDACPARFGISRIWVSPLHRRQHIATKLLRAVFDRQRNAVSAELKPGGVLPANSQEREVSMRGSAHNEPLFGRIGRSDRIDEVAFSQPTARGTKLARCWFGRSHGWKVYID